MLLEDSLQEADAKYLRVFGPEAPDKGYFFSGQYPAAHFIQQEVKDADFRNVSIDDYVAKFVRLGYTFVFSDGKNITVQTNQKSINFGHEAINAMEQSLGLKPDSQVTWNGQTKPAAYVFYGQPNHAATSAEKASEQGLVQLGMFGGIAGPGQFKNVNFVSHRNVDHDVKNGYAYVIRYSNDSIAVVTPHGFKFSYDAIESLEKQFGITPKKKVKWYEGQTRDGVDVDANVAIYGAQP